MKQHLFHDKLSINCSWPSHPYQVFMNKSVSCSNKWIIREIEFDRMAGSSSVPSSRTSDSAYSILEVESTCSVEDLRASYKRLILLHHPDKLNGSSELFQKVQIAWKLVCTPEDRKKYDMTANSGVYGSFESIPISDFKESDDGESISKLCRCGGSYEVHTYVRCPATASFVHPVYTNFVYTVSKSEKLSLAMKVIDTTLTLSCHYLTCALYRLQKKSLLMDTTLSSVTIALYTFLYQMLETTIHREVDILSSLIWRCIFAWGLVEMWRLLRLMKILSKVLLYIMAVEYWYQCSHHTVESSTYCLPGLVHSSLVTPWSCWIFERNLS